MVILSHRNRFIYSRHNNDHKYLINITLKTNKCNENIYRISEMIMYSKGCFFCVTIIMENNYFIYYCSGVNRCITFLFIYSSAQWEAHSFPFNMFHAVLLSTFHIEYLLNSCYCYYICIQPLGTHFLSSVIAF